MIDTATTVVLHDRLALFSGLSLEEKADVLLAATYNDTRLYSEDVSERMEMLDALIAKNENSDFANLGNIRKECWEHNIVSIHEQLTANTSGKIDSGFLLNLWMASQGMCPFVRHAFFKWHDLKDDNDVRLLAELSPTYLYKLVPYVCTTQSKGEKYLASGAYGDVYLSDNQQAVTKYPKNLAAHVFMNSLEIVSYEAGQKTVMKKYLPRVLDFDADSAIIKKQYIDGVSGWKLLEDDDFRQEPYALNQIAEIYDSACAIYRESGINMDIHPGNFQWNSQKSQWYLIDFGCMPQIGADYFPRENFAAYFQKIWLDLHRLMKEVPIRSLDIDMPQNMGYVDRKQRACALLKPYV